MKLFDIRSWSLTQRLSIFFTLAMTIIVLIVSAIAFTALVEQLKKKNHLELTNILQSQSSVIENIHDNRKLRVWQQRWFENIDPDKRAFLRVIMPNGQVFAESPQLTIASEEFPDANEAFNYKITFSKQGERKSKMLLGSRKVAQANGQVWLVQAALNVSQEREILDLCLDILKVVVSVALVISALLGWLIVRSGLKPLNILNKQIQNIHVERLNTRIGQQKWPRELKELAASFDDMLGRLESSFAELSRFSSDIAHEFRAPINNMVAAASVTQSLPRTPEEYQETLEKIMEEGERLSRMISSMLFLARADNSREVIHIEPVSTSILFNQVAEFFSGLAEERQIELSTSGDYIMQADVMLLRRAFSNLVDNALRYTPVGGKITLAAERENDRLILSVTDTGEGIEPLHIDHIFERFYCADSARSSNESTGLGLALVKSIVELHNGTIWVESEVGHGSRFVMSFPFV